MIKNYLKTAFRNLWKYKAYSLINIAGLSIGLASSFIIMLYSLNELSYDRYNENLENIYLVTTETPDFKWTEPGTPVVLGPALKDQYPDVQQFARWVRSNCPIIQGQSLREHPLRILGSHHFRDTHPTIEGGKSGRSNDREELCRHKQ